MNILMFEPLENRSISELDSHVKSTTIADKTKEVVQYLMYFLDREFPTDSVRSFLGKILMDQEILKKIVIVNNQNIYQTLLNVNRSEVTSDFKNNPEDVLDIYKVNAESIFINIQTFDKKNPYTKSGLLRKKSEPDNERTQWSLYYDLRYEEILNRLLDERNYYLKLQEFTGNPKYYAKATRVLEIINFCTR